MKTQISKIGLCLLAIGTLNISKINAQNVGINSTGSAPNNSAGLDIDFTNKGLLIPRVALTSSTDGVTIPSPATSLLVFHTGGGGLSSGYYYNAGTPGSPNWVKLFNGGSPADAWLTLGNAGTTPGTHFIGTTDNVDLVFKTNNIERARITNAGRVGINTSTPGSYYLDVLSNNSAIDGIRGQHTSGSTASAFAAITGSVSNSLYTAATGYLGYHNSNNVTFAVYGNGGDLAGMFNGKVGINSVSTNLTNYDLEIRNNGAANPVNTLLRATAQKPNINDVLTNLDFGDSYVSTAQVKIQVIRDAAASSASDLPTAIGFWTTNDGTSTPTEKMRITNNGNVGIGTTSPLARLNVYGGNLFVSNSGVGNDAVIRSYCEGWGNHDIYVFHSSNFPAFVGLRGRGSISSPAYPQANDLLCTFVGRDVIDGYSPSMLYGGCEIHFVASQNWSSANKGAFIRFYTTNNNSNAPTEKMRLTDAGNLCIGFTAPAATFIKLDANGWVAARSDYGDIVYIGGDNAGNDAQMGIWSSVRNSLTFWNGAIGAQNDCYANNFISTSDTTLKENILPMTYGLKEVLQLHPISFNYKKGNKTRRVGLIAQEVKQIMPELIDERENLYMHYMEYTAVLTKAIQEQNILIENLKKENEYLKQELQKQNQNFSAELQKIKQHIGIGESKK